MEIKDIGKGVCLAILRDARAGYDQWSPHAMFIEVLLAEQAVGAQGKAVIGRVDNDSIFALATGFDGGEYAADLTVELGYQSIVLAKLIANIASFSRMRCQALVAFTSRQVTSIEGVVGQKILRKWRTIVVIELSIRRGRISRIVRGGEGYVKKVG